MIRRYIPFDHEIEDLHWVGRTIEEVGFRAPFSKCYPERHKGDKYFTFVVKMNRRGKISIVIKAHGFHMIGAALMTPTGHIVFQRWARVGVVVIRSREFVRSVGRGATVLWLFEY